MVQDVTLQHQQSLQLFWHVESPQKTLVGRMVQSEVHRHQYWCMFTFVQSFKDAQ